MTLYRHFGPRRELFLEVLIDEVAPVAQAAGAVLADRSLPLADRAHQAMCLATLSLSATPLLTGVLGGGLGEGIEEIDPSGTITGLLTAALVPFLNEASDRGQLRGTPEEALRWVVRQLLASVIGRRANGDPLAVSREIATYFLPSLLRMDDPDCLRLAVVPAAGLPVPEPAI